MEKLEALRDFLGSLDMSFPKAGSLRPSQFNRVLTRVADTPNALLVNEVDPALAEPGRICDRRTSAISG